MSHSCRVPLSLCFLGTDNICCFDVFETRGGKTATVCLNRTKLGLLLLLLLQFVSCDTVPFY